MKRILIGLAALAVMTTGIAVATPSHGYVARVLGAGTVDSLSIRHADPTNTVFVRAELEPNGGSTGWHSHPANVFVLVKTGRVAVHDGDSCTRAVYEKGEVFVEEPGHVHKAQNVGDEPVVLIATFVGLAPDAAPTTDEKNPCLT